MLKDLIKELQKLGNPERANLSQRFFKTKKGQYGEGDVFLGIKVPETRTIVKNHIDLGIKEVKELLDSDIHEHRLAGLLILVGKYEKGDKENIFDFYLKNTNRINNWDLVDVTAPNIVGDFLTVRDKKILYDFAKSDNLWKKRIAIVSTLSFIRKNQYKDTLKIAEILLNDKHDLIHKAVGWMLREVGKKDIDELRGFLKKHYKKMPRTMLRYSIEKFPKEERIKWLKGEFE